MEWQKRTFRIAAVSCLFWGGAACGPQDTGTTDETPDLGLLAQALSGTCGNNAVEGFEECDGSDDASCPGKCSSQCACPATLPTGQLEVHALDVEQGDAILVVSPDGFVMLIDSGEESNAATISSYLAARGIGGIDYTVVSHLHADHLGAMDLVLADFPGIVRSFDNGRTETTTDYQEYNSAAGSRRSTVGPGSTIDLGPAVQAEVLHGDVGSSTENNNSVVIRLTHGSSTFLLGGDCESGCENDFDPGLIDVYKVHHHGSSTASSTAFLALAQPATALISVGADNPYGHPSTETLDRLAGYSTAVYRSDLDGDIVVYSDGASYSVNAPLSCSDGQTRPCGTDVGACALGTQTCSGGSWGACLGEIGPVPELCSNGLDDDCDGATDGVDPDCSAVGHLLIAQVGYDTPGTDSLEEFVDIYNPTGSSFSLNGWSLADNAGSWSFPAGVTIGAGAYLSIASDAAGFASLYGLDPDISGMTLSLSNTGDRLTLYDGATPVDHVAWESYEAGWTVSAATGDSIERLTLMSDTDLVDDWGVTSPATPRGGPKLCSNDADCDDGLYCNGAETCDSVLGCQAGTPVACDDGLACTVDSCNESTDACDFVTDDGACDDGLYCNGTESCDPVAGCLAGTPVACDDGVACTVDACNESTDACEATPSDGACDDGSFCNGAESCDPVAGCLPGADPCPGQLCDEPGARCVECSVAADCDDGLFCNGAESCFDGTCLAGPAVVCDDGVGCTSDACNEATDSCQAAADDSACDDGLYCNGAETCDPVLDCQPGAAVSCDPATPICDETAEVCVECLADADCGGGTPRCDTGTKSCVACLVAADCDDGVFCNGAESCGAAHTCQSSSPPDCSGFDSACSTGVCDEGFASCIAQPLADGTACDSGDSCSGDVCQAGFCQAVACGPDHILIAQVSYDTPGKDTLEEFVELYNPTASTVSLTGWTLTAASGSWTFPAGVSLAPASYLIVARDSSGFYTLYGGYPDVAGLTPELGNRGDALWLRNDLGSLVDHVAWEGYEPGWPITASKGQSIERLDLGVDTDTVADWGVTSPATPRGL